MIWFTSDTHFGHTNIIKYQKRPFKTVVEMDEYMIRNWNSRVHNGDTIYHLGDFAFLNIERAQTVLNRLNGIKILVSGNHDKVVKKLTGWNLIVTDLEISINGKFIVLHHYAKRVWNKSHKGAYHFYGHSHGSLPGNSQSLDVGVDCWNYVPVTLVEIEKRLKTLSAYRNEDHHK